MLRLTPSRFASRPASSRPRFLIVTLRDFGDCLLAAPLGNALRELVPGAETWFLTFSRNAGILEGVPRLDGVIAVDDKSSRKAFLSDLRFLWQRFDCGRSTRSQATGRSPAGRQPGSGAS